jgi:tetratricopeptide (TPR) repeat protein
MSEDRATAPIEPATPFHRCVVWRLHDAYWAQRGPAAWQTGEVPFYSTSNGATARHHADLFAALVQDLESSHELAPSDEVWVLEAGCGLGLFAANFLAALAADPSTQPLLARTRYLLSDCSRTNLEAVLALSRVAPWYQSGHIVPALYDLRHPSEVRRLDQKPVPPLSLITSNYVCSVIPQLQLQRRNDAWFELLVETRVPPGDTTEATAFLEHALTDATRSHLLRDLELRFSWRPFDPSGLPSPHRQALTRFSDDLPIATFGYPVQYFDALMAMRPLLVPSGVIITSDYGSSTRDRARGLRDRRPQVYGNSLAQDTCFATFDAHCAEAGWDHLRTDSNLDSVHVALVSPGTLGPHLRAAFEEAFRGILASDELLDHTATARLFATQKDFARALRYWLRAVALDELNPELHYRIGECAIEAGEYALAIAHLTRGHALDGHGWDFDFLLGRATCLADQPEVARRWYEHSLAREPHPVTWTNLGVIHLNEGREAEAWACFESALTLDPQHPRALEQLTALRELTWQRATDRWRDQLEHT